MSSIETSYIDIPRQSGEYRIPVHTATPDGEFADDPSELVVFGQGIGEIGASQTRILLHMADTLNRRIVGYESRLTSQTQYAWNDAIDIVRDTHLRVMGSVTNEKHSIIGHSLFGLTAGAILPEHEDQVSALTLISPATVTPEAIVSDEWRETMKDLSLDERARHVRNLEAHWRRHTAALLTGFFAVGLTAETVRGVTNPLRSLRAGYDMVKDISPLAAKNIFSAIGVLANVSTMPELTQAQANGTQINIVSGAQDPVFRAQQLRSAVSGTNLASRLTIIEEGRGQGHSNMATLSGQRQIDVAAVIHSA